MMHATSNLAHIHFPFDPPLFSPASACQMQGIWQRTGVPGEREGATRWKEPGILNNHKESLTDQRQPYCILHNLEINLYLWSFGDSNWGYEFTLYSSSSHLPRELCFH